MSDDAPEPTLRELRARALASCKAEIEAALVKHECSLVAVPAFAPSDGGWKVVTRIDVIPK